MIRLLLVSALSGANGFPVEGEVLLSPLALDEQGVVWVQRTRLGAEDALRRLGAQFEAAGLVVFFQGPDSSGLRWVAGFGPAGVLRLAGAQPHPRGTLLLLADRKLRKASRPVEMRKR